MPWDCDGLLMRFFTAELLQDYKNQIQQCMTAETTVTSTSSYIFEEFLDYVVTFVVVFLCVSLQMLLSRLNHHSLPSQILSPAQFSCSSPISGFNFLANQCISCVLKCSHIVLQVFKLAGYFYHKNVSVKSIHKVSLFVVPTMIQH